MASDNFRWAADSLEEGLDVEFKVGLDLSTPEGKSKLAKEICALCNHGGGWIVLGREDDGNLPAELPPVLADVNQDTINQISSTYITPAPHCTLRWVRPTGAEFEIPIIRVPNVGNIPVCGRRNGPEDERRRNIGIAKAIYYTRAAGPVSIPISEPEQWSSIIRRCTLNDKTALLASLSVMVTQGDVERVNEEDFLEQEFEAIENLWTTETAAYCDPVNLVSNRAIFGFELMDLDGPIETAPEELLRAISIDSSGPHAFFQDGNAQQTRPYVVEVNGRDGLQARTFEDFDGNFVASVWRILETGVGVEAFSFWEDTEWLRSAVEGRSSRTWERGKNVWVAIQVEYVDAFMRALDLLVNHLSYVGRVRIKASYSGLAGRRLNSPRSSMLYSRNYVSRQDTRTIDLILEEGAFEESVRSSAIASIIQPLNKLFQGPQINAEGVVRIMANHRR